MVRFVRGDVVVVPFPFSAAEGSKRRPAIVLASWPCFGSHDYLLCMISSQDADDPYIIALSPGDIENGALHSPSYVRPAYMFAVGERRIVRKLGNLAVTKLGEVREAITQLLA